MLQSTTLHRQIAGILSAVCLVLLAASPVVAIEEGGIGGKPANPRADNPRSSSIFVYELQPGQTIQDEVQVINNSSTEKTLLVYAVDSQVASGGAFSCAQKVDQPVSVGTWVQVAQSSVTLQPGAYSNVPFTINVPTTASAGESNGCIVVQDAQRSATSENGGITLSFRAAIRVAITIPGAITKDLAFTGLANSSADKRMLRLTTGLKNNGNVSLDTNLNLQLKNLFGTTVQDAGGTFPVLARSEATFNFEVAEPFWGGWYTIASAATYNSDTSATVGEQGNEQTIAGPTQTVFIAPHPTALVIEVIASLAIVGAAAWPITRTLRHKKLLKRSKTYATHSGDTLHSIAKKAGVNWQTIARLNKLKPPYHLEQGQHLKIPQK